LGISGDIFRAGQKGAQRPDVKASLPSQAKPSQAKPSQAKPRKEKPRKEKKRKELRLAISAHPS